MFTDLYSDMRQKYDFNVNLATDDLKSIIKKVDAYLDFLDGKRYNIIAIARAIYHLRKFAERIHRYKNYHENRILTEAECDHAYRYIKESALKFLQKPVEGTNVYLYSSLVDTWIVVSPKGYLWLIYGTIQNQIHTIAQYVEEILSEHENVIDLKNCVEFINKIFVQTGYTSEDPILVSIFKDEHFVEQYTKLLELVDEESVHVATVKIPKIK